MEFTELIFSLIIALIITMVFALGFRNKGPWGTIWAFFVIIFLGVWAASLWLTPSGPLLWGVALIPIAFVGIILALVVSAAVPPSNRETIAHKRKLDPEVSEKNLFSTFNIYFWFLVVFLSLAVIIGYFLY